ncbi:MAG: hypothetical protein QXR17_02220 [Candidatus Bathyarchaeia archaeon]
MKGKLEACDKSRDVDIFYMLVETSERERKKRREELLAPLGVKEFFEGGDIFIDKRICHGVECKLCIKACPTNALFWSSGEVRVTKDLCIYCGACVLSCMVDHCITVKRKRKNGVVETFSTPREFIILQERINAYKRRKRAEELPKT